MTNHTQFDPQFLLKRQHVLHELTGVLLEAIGDGTVSENEGRIIAQTILSEEESMKDENDLLAFSAKISGKYGIFSLVNQTMQKEAEYAKMLEEHKLKDATEISEARTKLAELASFSS